MWGLSKVDIPNANGNIWRNFVLRVVKVDIEMEAFRKCLLRVVKVEFEMEKKTTFMEVIVFWDLLKSNIPKSLYNFPSRV